MIDVTKDLPDITRLNTVHHEGVPREHVSEHFVFVFLSSVAYMTLDKKKGLYCIKFKGYLGKWYPKIVTYYKGYNYNMAVEKWSKLCMMIASSQHHLFCDKLQGHLF